ncbi:hypothetical protein BU16DRAFT_378253 [Lophium mytilinum]|uniref:Uncharacterized protein n=1 Tax=Lophium mytilinum TaxID=390894 RepID=A0A6A6QW75_9PEZI|nr:hypothetical protein BU16DRAFT_378253 [Lophium mytilinum]
MHRKRRLQLPGWWQVNVSKAHAKFLRPSGAGIIENLETDSAKPSVVSSDLAGSALGSLFPRRVSSTRGEFQQFHRKTLQLQPSRPRASSAPAKSGIHERHTNAMPFGEGSFHGCHSRLWPKTLTRVSVWAALLVHSPRLPSIEAILKTITKAYSKRAPRQLQEQSKKLARVAQRLPSRITLSEV